MKKEAGETEALGKQFIEYIGLEPLLREVGLKTESVTGIHIWLEAGDVVRVSVDLVPILLSSKDISVT